MTDLREKLTQQVREAGAQPCYMIIGGEHHEVFFETAKTVDLLLANGVEDLSEMTVVGRKTLAKATEVKTIEYQDRRNSTLFFKNGTSSCEAGNWRTRTRKVVITNDKVFSQDGEHLWLLGNYKIVG